MKPAELLLLLLTAWTVVGALGITRRLLRGERETPKRHLLWIVATWTGYIALLLAVSLLQPARAFAPGEDQCFGEMCFAVVGIRTLPTFPLRDDNHLLQIQIRITNSDRKRPHSEGPLRAYLRDAHGKIYLPLRGLSGNRLSSPVNPGTSVLSQPIFNVPVRASGLQLIFTHGRRLPELLSIGDPDSLLHQLAIVPLSPGLH